MPCGACDVVETVVLLLTSRVGLMFFKVRIPGGGSEALMPMLSWNKSSFALPRPVGVLH
jgi:hypothetical protein